MNARRDELENGLDLLQRSLVEEPKDLDFISDTRMGHNNNLNYEMSVREQTRTPTMGQPPARSQAHANQQDGDEDRKRYDMCTRKDWQGTVCGKRRDNRTARQKPIRTKGLRTGYGPSIYKRAWAQNHK